MTQQARQAYGNLRLKRIAGFFRTLLRNRMAAVGLVFLLGYVFVAIAAPLITPYSPLTEVSGVNAQPEWVMYFPEGYYLSKNLVVVSDPLFNSPASVQAWQFSSTTASPNILVSYTRGVSDPFIQGSGGSMQVSHPSAGNASATLSRTFNYPYHGPPSKFLAGMSLFASGATPSNPISIALLVNRGDLIFPIYTGSVINSGQWSLAGVDSAALTTIGSNTPEQVIFSALKDYSFQLQVTFHGSQQLNIDNLQLRLLGTAWGILGTDFDGHDVFSWVVYGAQISLFVGFLAAAIGIGLGLLVGLLAGFLGPLIDQALMRFTDMILVIPTLPLLIVLVSVLGARLINIIIVIGFFGWMGFARVIRSQVLTLKERPFIEAAKAAGSTPMRTLGTHVFPNLVSLTYVNLALSVPAAILTEAALEFLGLGDPSVISWGILFYNVEVSGGFREWWWIIPPGISIAIVSLSFVLIGYALDELFNPKLRRRR